MRRSILLVALALAACTVGPDYHRPATPGEGGHWMDGAPAAPFATHPWAALKDPMLAQLLEEAQAANPDIAGAEARLRQARALRSGAAAQGLPQVSAKASAQKMELSRNGELPLGALPGFQRDFSLYDAGFDASWEIDLWGANRRAVEAATRQTEAARAEAQGVRLEVAAEVVRTYAALRGAQGGLAAARANAGAQEERARLTAERLSAGEAAAPDEARARAAAQSARAAVPALEAGVRSAIAALAALTGHPPEALLPGLSAPAPVPAPPADVAKGLRSEVLRRRPDVIAAEANLAAATARVGVAVADLFPRLTLLGGIEQQSRTTDLLTSGGSTAFAVGPALHWPVFDAGRIRANIRAAHARADEAGAAYTKAVLGALADSESSASAYAAAQQTLADSESALAAAGTALDFARQRYSSGEDDRAALLEAESAKANAERTAFQAREQALVSYAALIKSLGG